MRLLKTKLVLVALSLAMTGLIATHAVADDGLPTPILPDTLRWIDAPGGLPLQATPYLSSRELLSRSGILNKPSVLTLVVHRMSGANDFY